MSTIQDQKQIHGRNEIVISDLSALVASEYLSAKDPNLWRAIPYETGEFAGVMVACGEGAHPLPITIRLGVQGLHRIWLGVYSFGNSTPLRVRLSKDLCCQTIQPPPEMQGIGIESVFLPEIFWKEADLTDQDLIAEPAYESNKYPAALACIRLEPIKEIQPRTKKQVKHPLTITNDGHGIFGRLPHSRPEDLLEEFENIPEESCMQMLLWGVGNGDVCNYPTKIGNHYPSELAESRLANYDRRTWYDNIALWQKKGWDSLELIRAYTKKRKWELHVYIRVEAFDSPFPLDRDIHSEFFHRHPDYHCRDRNGQRVRRLSYAYPEVRQHMLDLMIEMASYEPDGICLAFIRGVPLVLYEAPMVEGFRKRFGVDPRQLSETDPRWIAYQAEVITRFLREVRARLKPGQRLSAIVPGNELDCRKWGLDVESWIADHIVDDLFPTGQRFDELDVHRDAPGNLDFEYFNHLDEREGTRLIPLLYPWEEFTNDYPAWRRLTYSFLDQGADGYAVWDASHEHVFTRVGDIGHEPRSEFVSSEIPGRKVKLLNMEGFRFDRYHHFEVI